MCGCSKKISGMKRRGKTGKIPYELLGGAAVGAGASAVVAKVTEKIPMLAANPSYVSYAKVGAGIAVMMYGGKSQFVQGLGLGMVAKGGQEVIANTGVLDSLLNPTIEGMPRLNSGMYGMPNLNADSRRHIVMPASARRAR